MGQLNVLAATAENEEQHTLRNKIYIAFENFYSFFLSFLRSRLREQKTFR